MWMFAPFGVLMPAMRPEKYLPKGDLRTLQIRSRRAQDLDILRALYMQGQLGPTLHTPDKDYEYRAYCKPEDFAWAVFDMIMKIDYTKFKPETDNFSDHKLHSFYTQVWSLYLQQISSRRHQDEYWSGQGSWRGGEYFSHSRNATYPHRNAGTNYPSNVHALPSTGKVVGSEVELPDQPDWDVDRPTGTGYPKHRGGAADRDEYVAESWEGPAPAVGSGGVLAEVDAVLDAHYQSAAAALGYGEYADDDDDPEIRMSHAGCAHGPGDAAKRRCLRRRRRAGVQPSA